jgi:uncharacterized protein
VEQAEAFLRSEIGLQQVRVRHHGELARLEVEAHEIVRMAEPDIREHLVARLRDLGFLYVTLDLAGFRSGSMNAMLDQPAAAQEAEQPVIWLEPTAGR